MIKMNTYWELSFEKEVSLSLEIQQYGRGIAGHSGFDPCFFFLFFLRFFFLGLFEIAWVLSIAEVDILTGCFTSGGWFNTGKSTFGYCTWIIYTFDLIALNNLLILVVDFQPPGGKGLFPVIYYNSSLGTTCLTLSWSSSTCESESLKSNLKCYSNSIASTCLSGT